MRNSSSSVPRLRRFEPQNRVHEEECQRQEHHVQLQVFKAKMHFFIDTLTGLLNPTPIHTGRHTRACIVIVRNGGDPDDFDWEGKPSFEDLLSETEENDENDENDENADPNVSPHKVCVIEIRSGLSLDKRCALVQSSTGAELVGRKQASL